MDSQNNGSDQFDRDIDKAAQAFKNGAGKSTKGVGKMLKKSAKKAAKAAAKAIVKAGKAIGQALIHLLATPVGWILIGVFLLIILIAAIANSSNSKSKEDVNVYFNSVYKLSPDWKERLNYSFYAYYSDHSYYYYVDDDKELKQAGFDENQPKDKEGKESSFALSAGFLKFLDEEINQNHKMPEQFIKPIFNTCVGKDANNCKLQQLTDKNGDLVVKSQFFEENKCKKGDKDCIANTYKPGKEEDEGDGVWDYGFAPIIHYAKKQDKTWVENYRVTTIRYYDEKDKKYKTCNKKSDCEEVWEEVNNHDTAKKYIGKKTDETTNDVYLIDNVATFVGDINTEIQEETKDTGQDVQIPGQIKKVKDKKRIITDETNLTSKKTKEELKKEPKDKDDSYTYHVVKYVEKRLLMSTGAYKDTEVLSSMKKNNTSITELLRQANDIHNFGFDATKNQYANKTDIKYYKDGEWSEVYNRNEPPKGLMCKQGEEDKVALDLELKPGIYSWKSTDFTTLTGPAKNKIKGIGIQYAVEERTYDCDSLTVKNASTLICKTPTGSEEKITINCPERCDDDGARCSKTEYVSVDRMVNHTTSYIVTGDRWETAWGYKDDGVNIDVKDNGKYMNDYINNYTAFEPTDYYTPTAIDDALEMYLEDDAKEVDPGIDGNKALTVLRKLYGENILAESIAKFFGDDEEEPEEENGVTEGQGIKRNQHKYDVAKRMLDNGAHTSVGFVGDIINEAASTAGISRELFYGMISIESEFNMSSNSGAGAVGFMQVLPTYHTGTKTIINPTDPSKVLTVQADANSLATDPKTNIVAGVSIVQGYINEMKGNLFAAIQSYNNGINTVKQAIRMYAEDNGRTYEDVLEDKNETGWLAELPKIMRAGSDFDYAAKVFDATPADKIEYYYNGTKLTFDVKNLKVGAVSSGMSMEEYIKWSVNKEIISEPNNWKLLFIKPQESAKVTLKKNKVVYDKNKQYYLWGDENSSKEFVQKVIASYFAEQDNVETIEYMGEITDSMWREHFASFFSTADSAKIKLKVKAHNEYFSGNPTTPLEGVYKASRKFGVEGVLQGKQYRTKRYDDIQIKGKKEDQKVNPVASGTVTHVTDNTVTIRHKNNDDDKMQVETVYSNFIVDSKIKEGKKVKPSTKLGKLDGNEPLSLELIVNDKNEDPSWILVAAKELHDSLQMGTGINPNAIMGANEDTKKMVAYLHAHAEEMEAEFEEDSAKQFDVNNSDFIAQTFDHSVKVTGIAWRYFGGSGDPHDAVDLAPETTDAGYYAFSDAIIIAYADGFPNSGGGDPMASSYSFGLANYSTYLFYGTDGNWYQMTFGHCLTNTLSHLTQYADLPMVEKGARLGTIGNSGMSFGYHTHLTVVKWDGQSLREIADHLAKYTGKWSGYLPADGKNNPSARCDNPGKTPCQMAPHQFFGISLGNTYPGLVPKHN